MSCRSIDRGWAWVVLAAAFGSHFTSGLLKYGTGVFLVGLLEEFKDNMATTSLVGSVYISVFYSMGPLSSILINTYSCRVCMMVGGILGTIGYAISFFLHRLDLLILTYGIIAGAGTALSGIPAVVVVGFYFKKYLGIAVGVNVTGAGLGTFASGPLLHFFLDKYGVHGSFLLMACIVAQAVIFGALVIPSHLEIEAKIKNKIANDTSASFNERCKNHFRIFQNKTFSLILLAFVLWNIPYGIILMHLPNYSISTGVSEENAALLITIFGLGSSLNRILTGLTQGPGGLDPILLFMGFQGLLGTISFLFPLVSKSFIGQVVYAFLFGIYTGGLIVLMNPVSIELVGLAQLPTAIGLMFLMSGVASILGPPLSGYIVDSGGTYETSFYISEGFLIAGSLLTLLSTFWRKEIKDEKADLEDVEDIKGSLLLSGSLMLSGSLEVIQMEKQPIRQSCNMDQSMSGQQTESMNSDVSDRHSYDSPDLPNTKLLESEHMIVTEHVVNKSSN